MRRKSMTGNAGGPVFKPPCTQRMAKPGALLSIRRFFAERDPA
jgi:hypothetical protein